MADITAHELTARAEAAYEAAFEETWQITHDYERSEQAAGWAFDEALKLEDTNG